MEVSVGLAEQVVRLSMARRRRLVRAKGSRSTFHGTGSFFPSELEWRAAETRRCVRSAIPRFKGRWKPTILDRNEVARYSSLAHVAYLAFTASACFRTCLVELDGLDLPPVPRRAIRKALGLLGALGTDVEVWEVESRHAQRLDRRERASKRLKAMCDRRRAADVASEEDELAIAAWA